MSAVSPQSRGRKRKKSTRQRTYVEPAAACDCPACTGEISTEDMAGDILDTGAALAKADDPLDAELVGAMVATASTAGGAEDEQIDTMIAQLSARGGAAAVALFLGIGAVASGRLGQKSVAAARDLIAAGHPRPPWADELAEPVTVSDCQALNDPEGTGSILSCAFHRAGRSHAMLTAVDETDCGAAQDILLLDAEELPMAMATAQAASGRDGQRVEAETLDPAEFRWRVERALNARAVHDETSLDDPAELVSDEDGASYPVLAALLRARLKALPEPTKPPAPHDDSLSGRKLLSLVEKLAGRAPRRRPRGPRLPAKRKKSAGPAPIYQIKVTLRGSKPPIWRRLEVPADIGLRGLHHVLQVAFDWDDSHLHVFETPYGQFGDGDPDLEHRDETPVALEQVAPGAGDKIVYLYDFGDGWEHEIVVEKVLDRDPAATYPRCTGGRRAAPPEDCGGVWGYASMLETLADPDHPEHQQMLEWLGLDDPAEFDPAAFDAKAVTRALA